MLRVICLFASCVVLSACGSDSDEDRDMVNAILPESTETPNFEVGPTLQSPAPNGMVVMFETAEKNPVVWLREHGSKGSFRLVDAKNAEGFLHDDGIFFAELEGLDSNTLYEYAVVTGSESDYKVAGPYAFKTWAKTGDAVEKVRFAAFADSQDGVKTDGVMDFKRSLEQGLLQKDCGGTQLGCLQRNIAGIIISGDLIATGSKREEWRERLFNPLNSVSPFIPIIPAAGNHEYFGEPAQGNSNQWMLTYRKYFAKLPSADSTKHPNHWYHLDYQGLRVVSTDLNPTTATHNTGGWDEPNYDYGRKLFHESYMREQLEWFKTLIKDTREQQKSHVFLLNHQPCLSTKWRTGEALSACDFITQLEDYGRETNAITASINGHVHTYERGHSMDTRNLWLNVAAAGANLEPAWQKNDSDLDTFVNTYDAMGYGVLTVDFGQTKKLNWQRHHLEKGKFEKGDQILVTSDSFDAKPKLVQADLGQQEIDSLSLSYQVEDLGKVYEAHWQLSQDINFSNSLKFNDALQPVFDVWGDDTRRENWTYVKEQRINTRANADVSVLLLGSMLKNPTRIYPNAEDSDPRSKIFKVIIPGANDLAERWNCARKWHNGDNKEEGLGLLGGRQCFARLTNDNGDKYSPFDPYDQREAPILAFEKGQNWYYRVRVRNENLNWSDWSNVGSFHF